MRVLPLIVLLLFTACKKEEDRTCFKFIGDEDVLEFVLGDFDKLVLGKNLKYVFIQDIENKIILSGGDNLLNFIRLDVSAGELTIEDENKCNFLRNQNKKVTVEIHYIHISEILFQGTEKVEFQNQMITNNLLLNLRDGAGEFNLNIKANQLNTIVSLGWGNFNIVGEVNFLRLDIKGNGFGSAYGLNVRDSVHVLSNSSELFKFNADGCFVRSQIFENGDVWYIGQPTLVDHVSFGSGQLIDKN